MWQEVFNLLDVSNRQELWGFMGVFLILLAYFSVQIGLDSYGTKDSQQMRFSLLNLIGAILVLVSLIGSDNYAAMLLESAWIIISLFGAFKALQTKNDAPI